MSKINLLADYLDIEPFAKEVARDPRTVRRWLDQCDGLPYTRIGNRILIHIPTAREWIFGRMRNRNPSRAGRRNNRSLATQHNTALKYPREDAVAPTDHATRRKNSLRERRASIHIRSQQRPDADD
jgi:hypothetical protein